MDRKGTRHFPNARLVWDLESTPQTLALFIGRVRQWFTSGKITERRVQDEIWRARQMEQGRLDGL